MGWNTIKHKEGYPFLVSYNNEEEYKKAQENLNKLREIESLQSELTKVKEERDKYTSLIDAFIENGDSPDEIGLEGFGDKYVAPYCKDFGCKDCWRYAIEQWEGKK